MIEEWPNGFPDRCTSDADKGLWDFRRLFRRPLGPFSACAMEPASGELPDDCRTQRPDLALLRM